MKEEETCPACHLPKCTIQAQMSAAWVFIALIVIYLFLFAK